MRIRKEFVVFGAVLAVFALVTVISRVSDRSKQYNRDDVRLDFSSDAVTYDTNHVEVDEQEGELGDFTGVFDEEPTVDSDLTVPIAIEDGEGAVHEGEAVQRHDDLGSKEGLSDDVSAESSQSGGLSQEQYASMMADWACGIDNELFESYLTIELLDQFKSHVDEEPYASLVGNVVPVDIAQTESGFSFGDNTGNVWRFDLSFDDGRVSGVTYKP